MITKDRFSRHIGELRQMYEKQKTPYIRSDTMLDIFNIVLRAPLLDI